MEFEKVIYQKSRIAFIFFICPADSKDRYEDAAIREHGLHCGGRDRRRRLRGLVLRRPIPKLRQGTKF
jgi:hypothetical protein